MPGSGKNWALGAAAYIACWAVWIFVVFIVYELVYSFWRRWRVSKCSILPAVHVLPVDKYDVLERPLMFPLYLSSPGFNLASMTSYTNFCFMFHIRTSAFSGEHGALRDGLAETAYFYSQNWPTVALLLPRAALSLALLLAFWIPQPGEIALIDAGISQRSGTFFRASDGTLTNYARGVLVANAAWTAWRVLVLLLSLCVSVFYWKTPVLHFVLFAIADPSALQGWPLDSQRARLRGYLWTTIPLGGRGRREGYLGCQR